MELDPIEVLRHLRALGYENVEPHLLQTFMKDLKKLIKYENRKSKKNVYTELNSENVLVEKNIGNNHCKHTCCNKKINVFERLSQPTTKTKKCPKAVSTKEVQTEPLHKLTGDNKYSTILKRKKMDPVSLNQYYQNEWQNHKVPGEKNHDQLRWQVKQMMIQK